MEQLSKKEPQMYRHMMDGGFVVRTSPNRVFNCVPTDQALEQTINREAKSHGGVIGFTLRKGALLRWFMTRHITGEYTEASKRLCASESKETFHEEVGDSRSNKDRKDVKDMMEYIYSQCQDPFNIDDIPDGLMNITTGQMASQKVEDSLKRLPDRGKDVFEEFVHERLGAKPTRTFWEPVNKCIVSTFADMKKALPNDNDRKLIIDTEVLFRRLLAVSKGRDVELRHVLTYELAAMPLALFHDDGTMRKTTKSELAHKLESSSPKILIELPQTSASVSSAYIIDGMSMIHSLNENQFKTFSDLAKLVQQRTVRFLTNSPFTINCVTIVFDRYDHVSSIKTTERERRGFSGSQLPTYQVQGSRQVPKYRKFLKGKGNKASLANYISNFIFDNAAEHIPKGKSIILAGEFGEGKLVKAIASSGGSYLECLYSNQEEDDMRMILHACSLSKDHDRIIIQCDDTDVLVLLVYYSNRGQLTDFVYMYVGHSGKERYIPVHLIAKALGPTVCGCPHAAHALTGCDTSCTLNKIGKKTAYSKLVKHEETVSKLKTFHEDNLDDSVTAARNYVLLLYGRNRKMSILLMSCVTSWLLRRTSQRLCFHPQRIPLSSMFYVPKLKHGYGVSVTSLFKKWPNQLAKAGLNVMMEASLRGYLSKHLLQLRFETLPISNARTKSV